MESVPAAEVEPAEAGGTELEPGPGVISGSNAAAGFDVDDGVGVEAYVADAGASGMEERVGGPASPGLRPVV